MSPATFNTLCALGAIVPLLFAVASGCSDSAQSRANNGSLQDASVRVSDVAPSEQPAETSGTQASGKRENDPSQSGRASEKVDSADASAARPAPAASRTATREITFDTLKFDIEKGQAFKRSMLTAGIEKLDGRRVRIRGYMLPSFQQSGIKQFVLVRDNMECCFGPGAALYDCLVVEMVNDQSCNFSVRPIAVEGTFSIREFKGPDDMHLAVFHLAGERVR